MRGNKGAWLGIIAVACAVGVSTAFADGHSPDSIRYFARTGDSKLRLGIRDDRVKGIVFHGHTVCRDGDGDPVEPWYGTGVTSAFNDTGLEASGDFSSQQRYRPPQSFDRSLVGNIKSGRTTVNIHYKAER